jgi:hypothetical protein
MNVRLRSVPFVMSAITCLILVIATWKSAALHQQNRRLRAALTVARAEFSPGTTPPSENAGDAAPGHLPAKPPAVPTPLADEQAALTRAKERVEKAAALLGVKPDDEVKSFGRIESLAGEGIEFIALLKAYSSPAGRSASEDAQAKTVTDMMAWAPKSEIISGLEAQPVKIARLFASALQQALNLDAPTAARLQPLIQAEFEKLAALNLTRPQRPERDQAEWYKNRDTALKDAAARIETAIPEDHRKPLAVEEVLHLGTGIRSEKVMNPDNSGHGTITMGFYLPVAGKK